jgi:hypothetical protein
MPATTTARIMKPTTPPIMPPINAPVEISSRPSEDCGSDVGETVDPCGVVTMVIDRTWPAESVVEVVRVVRLEWENVDVDGVVVGVVWGGVVDVFKVLNVVEDVGSDEEVVVSALATAELPRDDVDVVVGVADGSSDTKDGGNVVCPEIRTAHTSDITRMSDET